MLRNYRFILILIFSHSFLITNAIASKIDITGYTSLIGAKTDAENASYLNEYATDHIDFTHHSLIGLQLNADVIENLELSVTLLGKGKEEFKAEFSWFYATYTVTNNSSLRFGRLKVPIFMVSNYIDIGHAYPWVTPPPEVYSLNVIDSNDGLEYIFESDVLGSTFLFNTYIGSDKNDHYLSPSYINDTVNSLPKYKTGDKVKFDAHDIFGIEISFATDYVTFRASHNQAIIDSDELKISSSRMSFGGFGIIVDVSNFILYAESVHRFSTDSLQTAFPDQNSEYVTLGYKISKFMPYITYASIGKGKKKTKYGLTQKSSTAGLRYDVNTKMSIKLQATKIKPGFETGDVGRYGLFDQEIKTGEEPNVYSMSVDILF
jgi:hypothetical protein